MSVHGSESPLPGEHVVIRTPDRREFRGILLSIRDDGTALVRLDTGWETSYPAAMVHRDPAAL